MPESNQFDGAIELLGSTLQSSSIPRSKRFDFREVQGIRLFGQAEVTVTLQKIVIFRKSCPVRAAGQALIEFVLYNPQKGRRSYTVGWQHDEI